MTGRYRRAIRIRAADGRSDAEIEDDFHHFAVSVFHDGVQVTDVEGRAVRYPWSKCPLAAGALLGLRGLAISTDPTAVYRHVDPLAQCTHMLEIAGLAVTQAARGPGERRWDVSVSDPVDGRVEAELVCDGATAVRWTLRDGAIAEPDARRGQRPAEFRSSALRDLPHEEAEALLILRRAIVLAGSRGWDVDRFPNAGAMGRGRACFVFSPGVAEHALRRYGSVRDFSTGPHPLTDLRASGDAP